MTEEVLYREALKLGLDRNDLVIRRRMRQKMEFLREDLRDTGEPTDAELAGFLKAHPDRFREPERTSFRQRFVDRDGAGSQDHEAALRLLERLRSDSDTDPGELGDPTLLPHELSSVSKAEIAGRFGEGFARAIAALPEGRWAGPVASEFGLHVVLVTARRGARVPALSEIRSRVARDWEAEQRREATEQFHRMLRERYRIEVQGPAPAERPELALRAP